MVIAHYFLEAVVDMLLEPQEVAGPLLLQTFDDIAVALSIDTGISIQRVQTQLIERILQDPRHLTVSDKVFRIDDCLHLVQTNH